MDVKRSMKKNKRKSFVWFFG